MIKAIETFYKGYRFRSRLETRWAVFFDYADIEYKYECEGFEIDGVYYLPDFYLPELDTFVEVKGVMNEFDEFKIQSLAKYKNVLVVGDIPADGMPSTEMYTPNKEDDSFCYDTDYQFCECPRCGKLGLQFDGRGWRVDDCEFTTDKRQLKHDQCVTHPDKGYTGDIERFKNAYAKARQARFEYGEKGA